MNSIDQKEKILNRFFDIVIFTGWSQATLKQASEEIGFDPILGLHYFPNGPKDIINFLAQKLDEELARSVSPKEIQKMRVQEKIAYLTKKRIMLYEPYRQALESYGVHLVFPQNALNSFNAIARTVDLIWFMAGDTSTDYNYYSKRGLLGLVYVSTALFWMSDKSDNYKDSWEFLDRRIQEVLKFGRKISSFLDLEACKSKFNFIVNIFESPKRFYDRLSSRDK